MAAGGHLAGNEAGAGLLATVGSWIYWVIVIEVWLVLTCLPMVLVFLLMGWTGTGSLIAGLTLVFVGPAVAAALFAWKKRLNEPDMSVTRHFFRGYRLNLKDVLVWWVPWTLLVTAVAVAWTNRQAYDGPDWILGFSAVILVALFLVGAHMLQLSALFSFRVVDRVRLAVFSTVMHPVVTLGYIALLFIALVMVWVVGDLAFLAAASLFTLFAYLNGQAVERDVTRRFVATSDLAQGQDDSQEWEVPPEDQ